jgi:Protein of unknown function (DUF2911)
MKRVSYFFALILAVTILFVFVSNNNAQQMKKEVTTMKASKDTSKIPDWNKKVRVSPRAFVTQTVGLTDVTISYSRPGVKGRKIWGGLVPYDKVWRAGANEATKITFSKDVMVNGHKVPAGSYGFFLLPAKNEWTVIFNKVADQWGAFQYNKAEDFLRFTVKPEKANFTEWLKYNFTDIKVNQTKDGSNNSAVVNMIWDKLKISFKVETI